MEGYRKYLFDNFVVEDKKLSKNNEEETAFQDNTEEVVEGANVSTFVEDIDVEKDDRVEDAFITHQDTVQSVVENIITNIGICTIQQQKES